MSCCDGTGFTDNPYERCVEHYEPAGIPRDWFVSDAELSD
jgi:hypothetical protein